MKTCSKCKQTRPSSDYYSNQAGKSWCKECCRSEAKARKQRRRAVGLCVAGCGRSLKSGNKKYCVEHAAAVMDVINSRKAAGKCAANTTCDEPITGNVYCARHAEMKKWARIKREYGLSREDFEARILEQGGVCPITGETLCDEDNFRRPVVDHCHASGVTRDILSNRANVILGLLEEDPDLIAQTLTNMLAYVAKWKPKKAA